MIFIFYLFYSISWQHNVNAYTCWFKVDHQLQMSPEFEILTQIKACACLLICFFLKHRINTFQRLKHALLNTTLLSETERSSYTRAVLATVGPCKHRIDDEDGPYPLSSPPSQWLSSCSRVMRGGGLESGHIPPVVQLILQARQVFQFLQLLELPVGLVADQRPVEVDGKHDEDQAEWHHD